MSLRADLGDAWIRLAGLLKTTERYDEAEDCCREALAALGASSALGHVLAGVLFEQGRVEEAIDELRAALALDPGAAAIHSDLLRALNYADGRKPSTVFEEHRAWAERHARPLEEKTQPHLNVRDESRRLRVGYVSPYFRKHAVTFFLESVIEHHDRASFDVLLYADVARPDEYSERLKAHGARWRSTVGKTDEALAHMTRSDGVDILVDLSGHTPANRLLAFARRPAPVQVTWNGYPNTTGMTAIDYRITDACCDPPGQTEGLHTERLVRLPGVYMSWRPPGDAPDPDPLPALRTGTRDFRLVQFLLQDYGGDNSTVVADPAFRPGFAVDGTRRDRSAHRRNNTRGLCGVRNRYGKIGPGAEFFPRFLSLPPHHEYLFFLWLFLPGAANGCL